MYMEKIETIRALLQGDVFLLMLVLGTFLLGIWLYRKLKVPLLQPLLISVAIIIPFLKVTGVEYEMFYEQTRFLNFMLGPSVVALGYVLYEQLEHIRGNVLSILTSVFVGCVVAIVSVLLVAKLCGADKVLMSSLAPKSVTTPIAMSISERSGGIGSLTAIVVILTGIFGSIVGPFVLRKLNITSKIAKGLALGSAAHGVGTAKAMEMGAVEGAVSGLAIGLMGLVTALLVPVIEKIL